MIDRQKSFPMHRDGHALVIDNSGIDTITRRAVSEGVESIQRTFENENPFKRFPNFFRKMSPNFNDPMVLYYLLDALYITQPGSYIRVPYVTQYLNDARPMYAWTVDLVGRMMAGLWETAIENYLDEVDGDGMEYIPSKNGDGEEIPEAKRLKHLPFALGRDSSGKYYVIDPDGTIEGRLWLLRFRMIAGDLAYRARVDEQDGHIGAGMAKCHTPASYYIPISPDPIGSAQFFRRRDADATFRITHRVELDDTNFWSEDA
jgi:hypothetical protein